MDSRSNLLPEKVGNRRSLKPKIARGNGEAIKSKSVSITNPKQKRAFGTARSTNISVETAIAKPLIKPSIKISQARPIDAAKKKSPEKVRSKPKSKFGSPTPQERNDAGFVTPKASRSLIKAKVVGTPYHSAENCSKCRFDKLETSSYWLGQIKLSESVGKHFVSAAFFKLALESNAEPVRNLRIGLKQYIARHKHLSSLIEWRNVCVNYGLLKDENAAGENSGEGKIDSHPDQESIGCLEAEKTQI